MAGEKFRIIARNLADLATVTSTVAPYSTAPLVNLKNDRRARVCRWPSSSAQSIKGHWNGQGYNCSGVALDRFNLEPAATVRFRGWASTDWTGSAIADTGTVAPYPAAALGDFGWGPDPLGAGIFDGFLGHKYWAAYFSRVAIASWQLDISDTTNSYGYLEASRLVLGDYFEPAANADYGLRFGWTESTEQSEVDGGSLLSDGRLPRRKVSGTFSDLTDAERGTWADITRYVGKRKTFLATFQPGEGGKLERDLTIVLAKFSELPEAAWEYYAGHALPFSIVEA
jgi:hypothetical protein